MAYWDENRVEPTPAEKQVTLAKLNELYEKAKQINEVVLEKQKELAEEFMVFINADGISNYEYDSEIDGAVFDIVQTAGLNEYSDKYNFWLPSNIGC